LTSTFPSASQHKHQHHHQHHHQHQHQHHCQAPTPTALVLRPSAPCPCPCPCTSRPIRAALATRSAASLLAVLYGHNTRLLSSCNYPSMCYWFGMIEEKDSLLLRLACTASCFSRLTWSWPAFLVAVPTASCINLTQPRRYLLLALPCLSFAFWPSQSTETRRDKIQSQHLTTNSPALATLVYTPRCSAF
jgi:hypothetical protein